MKTTLSCKAACLRQTMVPIIHIGSIFHMLKQLLSKGTSNHLVHLLSQGGSGITWASFQKGMLQHRTRSFYLTTLISLTITGSLSTCVAYNIKDSSISFLPQNAFYIYFCSTFSFIYQIQITVISNNNFTDVEACLEIFFIK